MKDKIKNTTNVLRNVDVGEKIDSGGYILVPRTRLLLSNLSFIVALFSIIGGVFMFYSFIKNQGAIEEQDKLIKFDTPQQKQNIVRWADKELVTKKEAAKEHNIILKEMRTSDINIINTNKLQNKNILRVLLDIQKKQNIILSRK